MHVRAVFRDNGDNNRGSGRSACPEACIGLTRTMGSSVVQMIKSHTRKGSKGTKQPGSLSQNKTPVRLWPWGLVGFACDVVELEGLEPSSKQAAKMPSTCLVCHWGFSKVLATDTPDAYLSPLGFRPCTRALHGLSRLLLMFPWGRGRAWLPGKQMVSNSFC